MIMSEVTTNAPATAGEGAPYSLWNDPDFWNVCEIFADWLLETQPRLPAPEGGEPPEQLTSDK